MKVGRSSGLAMMRTLAVLVVLGPGAAIASAQSFCDDHVYAGVPDFDQRRWEVCFETIGLPGDGRGHCYPTSLTNWLAYLANHGFPELASVSGPQNWGSPAHDVYNHVTAVIDELGTYMGTTPGGTPSTWVPGFHAYIAAHAPYEGFSISTFAMSPDFYAEFLFDGVPNMMRAGGFFELGIKWMNRQGSGVYWANGAHLVSLIGVQNPCALAPTVRLCDPGSGDDGCDQSTFNPFNSSLTRVTGAFDLDRGGPNPPVTMSRYRLNAYNGTNLAFVWGVRAFGLPMAVGRCSSPDGRCLRFVRPRWWDVDPRPPIEDLTIPFNAPILQIAQSPDFATILFTVGSAPGGVPTPPRLIRYRIGDGTFQVLMSFAGTPGPLAFDRFGELFVLNTSLAGGVSLARLDVSGDTAIVRASRVVSTPTEALVYDDVADELLGVTGGTDRIVRWPRALHSETFRPLAVPLNGSASVALSPIDNRPWIMGSGLNQAFELVPNADGWTLGRTAILPGATGVSALSMDQGARLYATTASQMMVFKQVNGQMWQPEAGSPFHGMALTGAAAMPRNRDTYTGAARVFMESDALQGFQPCPADFNSDGRANSQDFFDFLQAFFGVQPAADFNADDAVNSQDFFDFVSAFFVGC